MQRWGRKVASDNKGAIRIADAMAVDALLDMARRRGLHASRPEVEQTWKLVHGKSDLEKLQAAWAWLFNGHSVEDIHIALASKAQLPAWVVQSNAVGIVTALPEDGKPAQIDWIGDAAAVEPAGATLWVPVAPALNAKEDFVPRKRRGAVTEAILAVVRDHTPVFRQVALASLLINLISVVSSLFTMQVYDRVVPNFAYATMWVLASGVLIAYLFDLGLKIVRMHMLDAMSLRQNEAISLYLIEKLMALKADRRPQRVGTLVAQVRDYEAIKSFFTSSTMFAIADMPFILFFIVVIAMLGGWVALVVLAFVPLSILVGLAAYRPMAELQRQENDEAARRTGILFECVAGAEGIKAQAGEARFADVWLRATRESGIVGTRLHALNAYTQFASAFLQSLSYMAVIMVGVYVIESGHLTMGGLIACSILSGRVLATTSQITRLMMQWHHAKHSLEVLDQLFSRPTDDDSERQAHTHTAPLSLAANSIVYAYEGTRKPQLQVPQLLIKPGERIAVLGRNGSGKSTLLKLLAGIATPNQGQMLIAGMDYQACRPGWLREVVGYLPQDVMLYSGTLLENLTLGLSMPSEERIRDAIEKTGLSRTLGGDAVGLGQPIREGGSGLSGGQKQMVGITRLLLQNPKIWLLDEPSASLDSEAEERVLRLIRELPADRTVIFTSHRQSWLSAATRVIFVEDGAIRVDAPADQIKFGQGGKAALGGGSASKAVVAQ